MEGCWAGPHTPLIASLYLEPIGVRYPVEAAQVITEVGCDAEVLIGRHVDEKSST